MNTNMWMHPFTSKHLGVLREMLSFQVIEPISKKLACGDTGKIFINIFYGFWASFQ